MHSSNETNSPFAFVCSFHKAAGGGGFSNLNLNTDSQQYEGFAYAWLAFDLVFCNWNPG